MKVIRKQTPKGDRYYVVGSGEEPVAKMPVFKRFIGAAGWACEDRTHNFARNWLCCFGEQENNVLRLFVERSGSLAALCRHAVDVKDTLLCHTFWVNASEPNNMKVRELRSHEGLTFYTKKKDVLDRIKYPTPTTTWPHFRSERPLASVVPVPDNILSDMKAGFAKIEEMVRRQELVARSGCTEFAEILKQWSNNLRPQDEVAKHPLFNASVFAVSMLLRTRPTEGQKKKKPEDLYPNRKR